MMEAAEPAAAAGTSSASPESTKAAVDSSPSSNSGSNDSGSGNAAEGGSVTTGNTSGAARKPTSNLPYKKTMCRHWMAGHCRTGQKCTFSHGYEDLRGTRGVLCRFFVKGVCRHGSSCPYMHPTGSRMALPTEVPAAVAAAPPLPPFGFFAAAPPLVPAQYPQPPTGYKTDLCTNRNGQCSAGVYCGYAHSVDELVPGKFTLEEIAALQQAAAVNAQSAVAAAAAAAAAAAPSPYSSYYVATTRSDGCSNSNSGTGLFGTTYPTTVGTATNTATPTAGALGTSSSRAAAVLQESRQLFGGVGVDEDEARNSGLSKEAAASLYLSLPAEEGAFMNFMAYAQQQQQQQPRQTDLHFPASARNTSSHNQSSASATASYSTSSYSSNISNNSTYPSANAAATAQPASTAESADNTRGGIILPTSRKLCSYWPHGCRKGNACPFIHQASLVHSSVANTYDSAVNGGGRTYSAYSSYGRESDSHSRSAAARQRSRSPERGSLPYRTKDCKFFQQGRCSRGDACTFRHPEPIEHNSYENYEANGEGHIAATTPLQSAGGMVYRGVEDGY